MTRYRYKPDNSGKYKDTSLLIMDEEMDDDGRPYNEDEAMDKEYSDDKDDNSSVKKCQKNALLAATWSNLQQLFVYDYVSARKAPCLLKHGIILLTDSVCFCLKLCSFLV